MAKLQKDAGAMAEVGARRFVPAQCVGRSALIEMRSNYSNASFANPQVLAPQDMDLVVFWRWKPSNLGIPIGSKLAVSLSGVQIGPSGPVGGGR